MTATRPVLLLDLGGVLADLGDPVTAMGLDMTLSESWTTSPVVRALETGQIDAAEFFCEIPAVLGRSDCTAFADRFHAWQLVLFPGVAELIGNAASQYRVALLSNTNEIHWRQVTAASRLFDEFEHVFLSYETGHYKPEPAAFHDVTEYFDCAPGDIIFLDDSAPNITAARDLGIDARLVAGVSELERELLGVADRA